jgi:hypothetical protein
MGHDHDGGAAFGLDVFERLQHDLPGF